MEQYNINLKRLEGPYIHFTRDTDKFNHVYCQVESVKETQLFHAIINGEFCLTKKELLKQFYLNLNFPSYFSENWDSFDECINDLEWLESSFFVIFINNFELLLSKDLSERENFFEILMSSIRDWRDGNNYQSEVVPFSIIIHSNKDIPETFNTNLFEMGVNIF
ncbi:hypothetical protein SporoP8_01595 [Sporosarcina ureae]|uniref:barstar family protein n=1 Tax=Sporosarcina ureae TaxID=1571 RepID=UPI000A14E524|nr:barstar family protein [Sporosarcina ureae]ARJ37688.1 hypothetical protein SporoP8_01595 [Sporosarcina ureae]